MIDHDRQFIYIHIPKTAGVSIYHGLGVLDQPGHMTMDDYSDYLGYFSFTIVRNPWDRLVSTYFYVRQGGRGTPADMEAKEQLAGCDSFTDFVGDLDGHCERFTTIRTWSPSQVLDHYPHLLAQTFWTHDSSDRPRLDLVGRFDQLENDLVELSRVLGESILTLPHRNRTEHGPYREYYTRSTRRKVARHYERDVELLGFEF